MCHCAPHSKERSKYSKMDWEAQIRKDMIVHTMRKTEKEVMEQERFRALHYGWRRPWDGRGGKNYERWKRKHLNDTQWVGFQDDDLPYKHEQTMTYMERFEAVVALGVHISTASHKKCHPTGSRPSFRSGLKKLSELPMERAATTAWKSIPATWPQILRYTRTVPHLAAVV